MKRLQRLWRVVKVVAFTVAVWFVLYGDLFAQGKPIGKDKDEARANPYVIPYMLVLLGIGLGLTAVCRPSNRRVKAKAEQYEESKTLL